MMNPITRIKLIKSMEFIVRHLNCEGHMDIWLEEGVADGDIEYGDLGINTKDQENLEYWLEDEHFGELMGLFLRIMSFAQAEGGLYCDQVVSE